MALKFLFLNLILWQSLWHKETCSEGGFTFEMPLAPIKTTTEKGGIKMYTYTTEGTQTVFSLSYFNWNGAGITMKKESWEETYKDMKEGAFSTCDPCQIIEEHDLSTTNIFKRDLTMWQEVNGETYIYYKRTIFIGNKVWILTLGDLKNESATVFELAKYFYKSLKIS